VNKQKIRRKKDVKESTAKEVDWVDCRDCRSGTSGHGPSKPKGAGAAMFRAGVRVGQFGVAVLLLVRCVVWQPVLRTVLHEPVSGIRFLLVQRQYGRNERLHCNVGRLHPAADSHECVLRVCILP
jgi:hypothetical protein